ncbi:hypothetical protein L0F63_004629, partial [Massospora cicadina]
MDELSEVQVAKKIRLDPEAHQTNLELILTANNEKSVGLERFIFPDSAGFEGLIKK